MSIFPHLSSFYTIDLWLESSPTALQIFLLIYLMLVFVRSQIKIYIWRHLRYVHKTKQNFKTEITRPVLDQFHDSSKVNALF